MENKIEKIICEMAFDSNYNPFINFSYVIGDDIINMHSSLDEINNLGEDAGVISDDVLYVNSGVKPVIYNKNSSTFIALTYGTLRDLEDSAAFFKSNKNILFGYKSVKKYGFKSNLDVFYECMMHVIESASYHDSYDILFEYIFNGKKIGDSNTPENEVLEKLSEHFYEYKRNIKRQTPTMVYSDEELEQKGFKLD